MWSLVPRVAGFVVLALVTVHDSLTSCSALLRSLQLWHSNRDNSPSLGSEITCRFLNAKSVVNPGVLKAENAFPGVAINLTYVDVHSIARNASSIMQPFND